MAGSIPLVAQPRDTALTPRALRRADLVPAVIYGRDFAPRSLQAPYRAVAQVVRVAGGNRLVELTIEGNDQAETILIREVQRDPVSNQILHLDFYRIVEGQRITSLVPLVEQGRAPIAQEGGMATQVLEALEVECLPRDIPESISIDITRLVDAHSHLTVADLEIPENVTVLTPANAEVVRVAMPRKLEVEEVEALELEIGVAEAEEAEEAEREEAASESAPET